MKRSSFQQNTNWFILIEIRKKFNMQTMINLKKLQLISKTNIRTLELQIDTKLKWKLHVKKFQDKMTNQTLALTKLIAFIWKFKFSKVRHIYKTMIRSKITYESMIWHEFKKTKLISQKTINALTVIQNNCLKRIFEIYKTIFIAKLKTKTHILFINIYLNKLQAKIKTRLQNSKHYERIKKIKRKIYRSLKKERNKHRKSKFISANQKKTWFKRFNEIIKKQKTINKQKQFSQKKLTNHFVKFWKNKWKKHQTKSFRNSTSARIKKIEKNIIQLYQKLAKAKNALATQIRIENVELANFLYKRRVSDIDSSACLCDHQRQTMKHVIVSCSQHDRTEIENEKKSMNYRNLINTTAELKKFTKWMMKLKILIQFTVVHEHFYSISDQ